MIEKDMLMIADIIRFAYGKNKEIPQYEKLIKYLNDNGVVTSDTVDNISENQVKFTKDLSKNFLYYYFIGHAAPTYSIRFSFTLIISACSPQTRQFLFLDGNLTTLVFIVNPSITSIFPVSNSPIPNRYLIASNA